MTKSGSKKLRLQVRKTEGGWQLKSGSEVPVKVGTDAELIVDQSAVTDPTLVEAVRHVSYIKILPEGTALRACLATKDGADLTARQSGYLIPAEQVAGEISIEHLTNWSTGGQSFIEVKLGPPSKMQRTRFWQEGGGLWLTVKGDRAEGLISSELILPEPVSARNAQSLNHAFTMLSETYEPWRISHTGNVYERFLYKESDGWWYPLQLLRERELAKQEHKIASAMWSEFSNRPLQK